MAQPSKSTSLHPHGGEEVIDPAELRILRLLAGGRRGLPARDRPVAAILAAKKLVEAVAEDGQGHSIWDLTARGVDLLVTVDGPLTAREREEWLAWGKTRFGRDDVPQKLLQRGWRSFTIPRVRALLERWRRYGIRQSG